MSVARGYLALMVTLILLVTTTANSAELIDAGRVTFAKGFRYAGQNFEKGSYQVRIEVVADGPMVVLSRDGAESVRELAVVHHGKSGAKKAKAHLGMNAKDEGRLRLTVTHLGMRYLAFFESASM